MKLFHSFILQGVASVLLLPMYLAAQPKSAIQFYDTTGTTETANIGWTGNATSGKFSVQTPIDGEVLKIENGNMTVDGTISTTAGFAGKGTALTDISPSSHIHPEIGTLTSGLAGKSDKVHAHSGSDITDSVPLSRISTVGAASQQVLTFTGTNAAWQNPTTSSGTAGVTSVGTDSGLVVNPTTGTVKISIGPKLVANGMLKDSVITGVKIKTNAVETANIADNAITTAKIAKGTDGQVLTSTAAGVQWAVPTGSGVTSVGTDSGLVVNPATGAVKVSIGPKLVANGMLKDSVITGVKIKTKAVETANLADGAVSDVKISGVSWSKLSGGSMAAGGDLTGTYPNPTIGTGKVTSAKILDGEIVNADISANAAIAGSKIDPNFANQHMKTNGRVMLDYSQTDFPFSISANTRTEYGSTTPKLMIQKWYYSDSIPVFWIDNVQSYHQGHTKSYFMGDLGVNAAASVGGNISASGNITAGNTVSASTVSATTCCSSSDIRLKKNICAIDSALSIVKKLNGVTFEWRKEDFPDRKFPDKKQHGLIAQQVEQIVPDMVTTFEDGYKAVSYDRLTALLIEAVKEQQKVIENYATRLEKIENMLNVSQAE